MALHHNNRKVIFVEDYSLDVKQMDGCVIALNSRVCARLDREGVEYYIIEDFWNLHERKEYGEGYQKRFLQWVDSFDEYLRENLQGDIDKTLSFVRLYGYFVSSFSDYSVSNIKGILKVFELLEPMDVFLLKRKEVEYSLLDVALMDYSKMLESICSQKSILFDFKIVDENKVLFATNEFGFKREVCKWLKMVKRNLIISKERIFSAHKRIYLKMRGLQRKVLIINDDWLLDFYKDVIAQGHDVYYVGEGCLKKSFSMENMSLVSTKMAISLEQEKIWKKISSKCIKEFKPSKWFNEEVGIDVSCLFDEFFKYFLEKVCPIVSCSVKQYTKYFLKYGITHTICPYKASPEEIGISAAAINAEVVAIQIEHGATTAEDPTFLYSELPVDVYVTCSMDQKIAFEEIFENDNKAKVKVVCADVWLKKYINIASGIGKPYVDSKRRRGKKKVCYVPSVMPFYRFNYLYDPCWYYKMHKEIFSYFANQKKYEFIIKVDGSAAYHYEPIKDLIERIGSDNLIYENGSLMDNYQRSDMVIVDFAATCAFESRLLGKPTLELCSDFHKIFSSSQESYGKTLRIFKTVDNAIELIDEFIKANPSEFIVNLEDNLPVRKLIDLICDKSLMK